MNKIRLKTITGIMLTLLLIGMLTSALNVQPVGADPRTIIVPDNYSTIQGAINAASPGDTIIVRAGTYTENVKVNKDHLTIKSESGAEVTIVQAANPDDHLFEVMADYVEISGFTVKGLGYSIEPGPHFESACVRLTKANWCHVSNNEVLNNWVGIDLWHSLRNTIVNNHCKEHTTGISMYYSSDNTICDNFCETNWHGIYLHSKCSNNMIRNNVCTDNINGIDIVYSSSNIIANNKIYDNNLQIEGKFFAHDSIYLFNAFGNTIKNNWVGRSGPPDGYAGARAIYVSHSSNNEIYLNDFTDNEKNALVADSNSTNIWHSPHEILYTYSGKSHVSHLGNYWSDYTGSDADGDGIGDTSYSIDGDKDNYPLMKPFENYEIIENHPPNQPTNKAPIDGAWTNLIPVLKSSAFADPEADDSHAASQWQITTIPGDYSNPVFDSGRDTSNLTKINVPPGALNYSITYYWRVRHQDDHGAWSAFSSETCFTTCAEAGPNVIWSQTYDSGYDDVAYGVAVDSQDNIIVTGASKEGNGSTYNYCTIKYASNGTVLWIQTFDSGDHEKAQAVAMDSKDNILVTGWTFKYYDGSRILTCCTLKYDPDGNLLWERETPWVRQHIYRGYGIAVDSNDNILIAGIAFDYDKKINVYGIVKYDPDGNLLWSRTYDSGTNGGASDIAVDSQDNFLVIGSGCHIVKYDSSGNLLWSRIYDSEYYSEPYGVAVDSQDNIVVTGVSGDGDIHYCFTIKYDADGNFLWSQFYNGGDEDGAYDVAVDSKDNIVVTGFSRYIWYDWCNIKYDPDGNLVWSQIYVGGESDTAHGVAVDSQDNVIVTGYSYDGSTYNYYTIKYGIPPEEWSFAIVTDFHIGRGYPDYGGKGTGFEDVGMTLDNVDEKCPDYYLTERLKEVVDWLIENKGKHNIHFVVVLGDITDSGERGEFLKAKKILDKLNDPNGDGDTKDGITYVPVIGNHDVWPYTEYEEADSPKGEEFFEEIFWNPHDKNFQLVQKLFNDTWKRDEIHTNYKNFAFSYKGTYFVGLDFVSRNPAIGKGVDAKGVLTWENGGWLEFRLNEYKGKPVILFSHHPMIEYSFLEVFFGLDLWDYIRTELSAFDDKDLEEIAEVIKNKKPMLLANFAGHIHGYYSEYEPWIPTKNPHFMDANRVYREGLLYKLGLDLPAVTTEAVMVASNEPTPKGVIRIVKAEGDKIDYSLIEGEFRALNPYFVEKVPVFQTLGEVGEYWMNLAQGKIRVDFEAYAFTKRFTKEHPLSYSLDYGDGSAEIKFSDREEPVRFTHYYSPKPDRTYDLTLTVLGYTPEGREKIIEKITKQITLPKPLIFVTQSPVNIAVIDPDGLTISKELNEIPGATYIEIDLDEDGDPDDIIIIPDRKIGDYLITVVPELEASLTDTYTLEVWAEGMTITLAEDIQIKDIPPRPYILRSTETEIIPVIPPAPGVPELSFSLPVVTSIVMAFYIVIKKRFDKTKNLR